MRVDPERKDEYREAYREWQEQLATLHRVVLDGEAMEAPKLKGLLGRESRAKDRYDAARLALLGVGGEAKDDPFANIG